MRVDERDPLGERIGVLAGGEEGRERRVVGRALGRDLALDGQAHALDQVAADHRIAALETERAGTLDRGLRVARARLDEGADPGQARQHDGVVARQARRPGLAQQDGLVDGALEERALLGRVRRAAQGGLGLGPGRGELLGADHELRPLARDRREQQRAADHEVEPGRGKPAAEPEAGPGRGQPAA